MLKIVVGSLVRTKNHIARNKMSYALGAAATAAVLLQQSNTKAFYAFLVEKGIDPMEYYNPEHFAEIG